MTRNFTGQCFECGEWGHSATDHQNDQIGQHKPVGDSVHGESAESEQKGGVTVYSFPYDPKPHEPVVRRSSSGIPKETGGATHFGVSHHVTAANMPGNFDDFTKRTGIENPTMLFMSSKAVREFEDLIAHSPDAHQAFKRIDNCLRTKRVVDLTPVRVSGNSDHSTPIQPQGQAGHGLLPGARVATQPDLSGAGLPSNNYRVQKPVTARGHGQQSRQMTIRDDRRERAAIRQKEEDTDQLPNNDSSMAVRGQQNVGRRREGQGSMTREQVELDNHHAPTSHLEAAGGPHTGDGSSGADRRQQDRSMNWQDPEYEVAPGEVVGLNLELRDVSSVMDRFFQQLPEGWRYNVELVPVSEKDSAASGPIIKGLDE